MGKNIQTELANTMISDRFEVFHVNDFVTDKTTYHTHDFYEIHCVLAGYGQFYVDEHQYDLAPGTITLISPNDLHRIVSQSTDVFERVYIFIDPTYLHIHSTKQSDLSQAFRALGKSRSRFITIDPEELRAHLLPLDNQPGNNYGEDLIYENHLINFLIAVNRLSLSEETIQPNLAGQEDALITQIMAYINENLEKNLTLDALADQFFTNKYHLSREFKKATGITLHNYVLKKRLLYSKLLLRRERSANAVYLQCGFKSYTHFLRSFKQEFKMTPKEFLKKVNEGTVVKYEHFEDQLS